LHSHRETLEKAANSDQHLFQRYNQYLNDIMILRMGENGDGLEKIFAETLASSVNTDADTFVGGRRVSNAESLLDVDTSESEEDINIKVHKVEVCLDNLNRVRKERMDTLNDLKEKVKIIIIIYFDFFILRCNLIFIYLFIYFYRHTKMIYLIF